MSTTTDPGTGEGTSSDLQAVLDEALAQPTLCAAFQLTAATYGDAPALKSADGSFELSWSAYAQRVRSLAEGLASLGVGAGDAVAMLHTNRPEFSLIDVAAMHLGAIPFSVYQTNPPEQIVPLLRNSGARVMVTEPAFLERVRATRELHPELEHLVVVDGDGSDHLTLEQLEERPCEGFAFEAAWRAVTPDNVLTLVYTSGTTGEPKGVQHTHATILYGLDSFNKFKPVSPGGRMVSYLPMAHIAERYISHYSSMVFGICVTFVPDPKQLAGALAATRPTRLFGVPRIYEKLAGAVQGMAAADPQGPLSQALEAGQARVRAQQNGEPVPELSAEHEQVLAGVRAKLGLDEVEWIGVAAAPSPRSMLEQFHAIGLPLIEFWGMSECVFSTSNPPDPASNKLGTVGVAVPGVEVKLAEDGEILVKGPNLMIGYRNEPAKTAEAIVDGWLHTGDVAAADEDGYLRIVDRKKELIINSAGKNMAPTKIELAVKECCPLVGQVVAIGDGRLYVTALIVLDEEACQRWATENGVDGDVATVAGDERVGETVRAAVEQANERLARVEQIKTHTIIPATWMPGGDELTATMKLKRRVINNKYATEIEAMYA